MAFPTASSNANINDTPIGGYCLLPSTYGDEVVLEGKTYLKSGVIVPSYKYPKAPADHLGALTPVPIGSGARFRSIAVDDLGYPWILCSHNNQSSSNWEPADLVKLIGLSSTTIDDALQYNHSTNTPNYPGFEAYKVFFWKNALITISCDSWGGTGSYNTSQNVYALYKDIGFSTKGTVTSLGTPAGAFIFSSLAASSSTLVGIHKPYTNTAHTSAFSSTALGTTTLRTLSASAVWTGVAWSTTPAVFVAIATGGTVASSSPDGVTWTARTLPVSANWSAICASSTRFVAVSSNSTNACYSDNGTTTWTATTLPASVDWSAVNFGNNMFIAVAKNTNIAAYSTNGTSWTQMTLPAVADWVDVVWSSALSAWIVCAEDGRAGVCYSYDGISWYTKAMPRYVKFQRLINLGSNTIVAHGTESGGGGLFAKSTDNGITWRYARRWGVNPGANLRFLNNKLIFAYGANINTYYVGHSSDGSDTWTIVGHDTGNNVQYVNDVGYINGAYLFAFNNYGYSGGYLDGPYCGASTDLVTFSIRNLGVSTSWKKFLTTTGNNIIAFGNPGVSRYSSNGTTWSAITDFQTGATGTVFATAYYNGTSIISSSASSSVSSSPFNISLTNGSTAFSWQGVIPPALIKAEGVTCGANRVVYSRDGGSTVQVWNEEGTQVKYSYTTSYTFENNGDSVYASYTLIAGDYYILGSSVGGYMYKVDTGKSVLNLKAGNESSGSLVYYMRVD